MGGYRIDISAPNLSCICIDETERGEYKGRIYHRYSNEAVSFQNSAQLIIILNRFFDDINYPQPSTIYRSLYTEKGSSGGPSRQAVKMVQTAEWALGHTGEVGTFFLHVRYRQNSTWQGRVIWKEGEESMIFGSVLELLRIINKSIENEEMP